MKALKLKGWVDGILGSRSQAEIATAHWFAVKPVPDMVRATLVIGEKGYTESDMKAAVIKAYYINPSTSTTELSDVFKELGLSLDPA